jgi:hypothetical protein
MCSGLGGKQEAPDENQGQAPGEAGSGNGAAQLCSGIFWYVFLEAKVNQGQPGGTMETVSWLIT